MTVRKCLLLALLMLTLCTAALAEGSVLPDLGVVGAPQSILPKIELPVAVSFGSAMGVSPLTAHYLPDGRWQEAYENVTMAQYDEFGVILGQRGLTASDAQVAGTTVSLLLYQDDIAIEFSYNYAMKLLTMTYPEGVATDVNRAASPSLSEQFDNMVSSLESSFNGLVDGMLPHYDENDPFGDHREIGFGTEILLTNTEGTNFISHVQMRLTPLMMHLGDPRSLCAEEDESHFRLLGRDTRVWMNAMITNIGTSGNCPAYLNNTIFGASGIYLHYITPDNHYIYESEIGRQVNVSQISLGHSYASLVSAEPMVHPYALGSLETEEMAICFKNVPLAAIHSESGTLAVTFASTDGDKYVLYLRK